MYNLNFPLGPDYMRDSQPLMLDNYAAIFTFIGADHVPFNNGVNTPGQHLQMTFPRLTAVPPVNPVANLPILFAQLSPFSGNFALFLQNSLNNIVGFSDRQTQLITSWFQLPSGIILKWAILPQQAPLANPITHQWQADTKPFATQLWAMVVPLNYGINTDGSLVGQVHYVTSIATPTQVSYNAWSRTGFTIGNPPFFLYPRVIFAIGV